MVQKLRGKLTKGEPIVVVNPDHTAPSLVESLGRLPVDAVFIDCEQGSPDVESVENMARAARVVGQTSLVRVFAPDDWVIERYMGRGVDGIVLPRLDTAQQAAKAVAAVQYCYPTKYSEKFVVVQIETKTALESIRDFAKLDGIDVLFIGPVDLSKSLGFKGDFRGGEMQRVIRHAVAEIRAGGKVAGMLVDRDNVRGYVEMGVRFLYTHADGFLSHGAMDFAQLVNG